jgi:hypothetical protein
MNADQIVADKATWSSMARTTYRKTVCTARSMTCRRVEDEL